MIEDFQWTYKFSCLCLFWRFCSMLITLSLIILSHNHFDNVIYSTSFNRIRNWSEICIYLEFNFFWLIFPQTYVFTNFHAIIHLNLPFLSDKDHRLLAQLFTTAFSSNFELGSWGNEGSFQMGMFLLRNFSEPWRLLERQTCLTT